MSGFGGFGFGQNNNQSQGTGFGGFGAGANNANTNTGFGSTSNTNTNTNTGFGGTNTTGGGLFGGGSTGFGSSGGGFGGSGTNSFGAKPFGSTNTTTGGSMFGGGTSTTTAANTGTGGFGGFGSTGTGNTASGFGSNASTGGGLFGANKPAFGSSSTSTPFGGGGATTSPFGGTTTGAFGAPAATALGGATGECQGTGGVAFQPFVEKEPNSTSNQQNSFQSICFQQPYQKFSPEELRLADYTSGRKFGNASNQPGAFGASSGFGGSFGAGGTTGGFGSTPAATTGGGLFGSGATSSPFGGAQTGTSGFGANATPSGGLFGAKPATGGGLFGAQTSAPAAGGMFGTSGSTGFGAQNTGGGFGTTNNTGGGLFSSTTTPAKPAFSFGTSQPAAGTTGFGTATSGGGFGLGGGGLFGGTGGQQNTATPFGGGQQASTTTPFGGFGSTQQQQQPTGGASLFGNNAQKPAGGAFGSTAAPSTGGGLFGGAQATTNTNPFGATSNTQNTGGLFGSKPSTTGTGLFGNTTTQPSTGGGLFGGFGNQNANTAQPSGSLFGGLNNNNQAKPSLFSQPQQQTGGSLFGGTGQPQGGGLFGSVGNNQQNQQPQNSLFGNNSLLGTSQQGQQTPQSLTASIGDNAAYGGASLFANLASTQMNNPGPIATPLSSSVRQKKSGALPMHKLNSASTSRFTTPQKRGFGFSYSTYGTPGSASSTSSTPGTFGGSTLGNTFSRTLKTSMSTSSLRRSFGPEDSILAPGAFSASPSARQFGSTGSVKKLNINRSLRNDLFTPPSVVQAPSTPGQNGILKKRVSFESSTANGTVASSPLKNTTSAASPSSGELGLLRPPPSTNGATQVAAASPEMEQVQNNELAVVHEEEAPAPAPLLAQAQPATHEDQEAGQYWMSPRKEAIEGMNRIQRSKVTNFTVGREGIGQVKFDVPVDLTNINLDEILGNIVQLVIRSATVYSDPAKKPPMGKGLNVPSTISLMNSWPRKRDGKTPSGEKSGARFKKHIDRLRKVKDTKFVSYDKDNGVWTFSVEHFTTYGMPEDDESDGEGVSEFGESTLSAPPDTPTPKSAQLERSFESTSQATHTESDPDDTFEFRKKKVLPGAFDNQDLYVDDEQMDDNMEDGESFLDERSVGSLSENGVDEPMDQDDVIHDDESVSIVDQEMAGSYPRVGNTTEPDEEDSQNDGGMDEETEAHDALTRARIRAARKVDTPVKRKFDAGNDWTATLRRTISPQKQDRAALKSITYIGDGDPQADLESAPTARRVVSDGRGFATSIDLMNSLFGQTKSPVKTAKAPANAKGFEWPYAKRPKTAENEKTNMTEADRAFHESVKSSWGPDGTLVYASPADSKPFGKSSRRTREKNDVLAIKKGVIVSEGKDVRFAKFSNEASASFLKKQQAMTIFTTSEDVPFAQLNDNFLFSDFCDETNTRDPAALHDRTVWTLASILWDKISIPEKLEQVPSIVDHLRKEKLSTFWQKLVEPLSTQHVALAKSNEEKAIASLSGHRVADACGHLINGKDFHLATLIALIGGKRGLKKDIREQLSEWQKSRVLSEFNQPVRALYEMLAGNVSVCEGSKGALSEDRIESFIISKRFGLSWRQAFGLRLWYGILPDETLEDAVEKFMEDLSQEKESAKPHSWYVEEKIPALWEDKEREEREDLLWGLLKLYSFQDIPLERTLGPANSQLSPLNFRLAWQLSQALISSGAVRYEDNFKADQTTISFAAQLVNEGCWLDAVFVLLHLSSPAPRAKSIRDHLARFAGQIGPEDSESFTRLTKHFKIPTSWVWEAKALYKRSVDKDPRGEVQCLIKAGSFNEAHRTFAREVAPKNVVELDNDVLRSLLDGFRGKENSISEWHLGGQIYLDYLELLESRRNARVVDYYALERLLVGLPAVVEESRHPSFMERVAIETISGTVAKAVIATAKQGGKVDLTKVLRLPLTEDNYLKHTVDLSIEYYRSTVASR